jgi:hypothetical protein
MGDTLMSSCRRFIRAAAVIALILQVMVTSLGAISVCVDRPHTHAGVPAPDCAMHHQPSPAASSNHHEHHGHAQHGAASDTRRIVCRCAADPRAFLVSDIGVLPSGVSVRVPARPASPVPAVDPTAIDLRIPPPSPPPRPTLT